MKDVIFLRIQGILCMIGKVYPASSNPSNEDAIKSTAVIKMLISALFFYRFFLWTEPTFERNSLLGRSVQHFKLFPGPCGSFV